MPDHRRQAEAQELLPREQTGEPVVECSWKDHVQFQAFDKVE